MSSGAGRKLILIVIDGLAPGAFEAAVESGRAPALAFLCERGRYGRAVSAFPSLTPVCLSSLVTGGHPDVHGIPHLVWYDRAEGRLVEYGSSLGAVLAAGPGRSLKDTVFEMNERHLSPDAVTVFEALEDAGLVPAAVNVTCYRGRTPHRPKVPGLSRTALGPRRFFYYSLFESDEAGTSLAVRRRAAGSVDGYAAAAGRWLVTRDGFDFLFYYLSDYDYASHAAGPGSEAATAVLERSDRAVEALMDAAGGREDLLDRYDVLFCSDHGQTHVSQAVRLEEAFAGLELFRPSRRSRADVVVAASNRAAQVYRMPGCAETPRQLAGRLERRPEVEAVAFLEDREPVVRLDGADVPLRELGYPDAEARVESALRNPHAGDVLVSAKEGFEFCDLGGRHHAGGGSHGSLAAGDSDVPVVAVGIETLPRSIVEVAPLVLSRLGVEPPAYALRLTAAA